MRIASALGVPIVVITTLPPLTERHEYKATEMLFEFGPGSKR
jgi:hypothetical protein